MSLFKRLSNGWQLGKTSLLTIRENPELLFFPIISGAALLLVTLSFFGGGYLFFGEEAIAMLGDETTETGANVLLYGLAFAFYLVTYFVIVFFNVGLVHCAKMVLEGRETSVAEGIRYAQTRMGAILGWAVLAATVGIILKTIQERAGAVGGIITGLIGMIWGIATFFVVPVIAYEDVSPIDAVKRSASIMKDTWGESLGANFSFGLFSIIGILFIAIPTGFLLGFLIHPVLGVLAGILVLILVQAAVSAANTVFLAAAYQHVNDAPTGYFESDVLDDVFVQK